MRTFEEVHADTLAKVLLWEKQYGVTPVEGQTVEERLDALNAHLGKRIAENDKFLKSLEDIQVQTGKTLAWVKYAVNAALVAGILAIVNHCAP